MNGYHFCVHQYAINKIKFTFYFSQGDYKETARYDKVQIDQLISCYVCYLNWLRFFTLKILIAEPAEKSVADWDIEDNQARNQYDNSLVICLQSIRDVHIP